MKRTCVFFHAHPDDEVLLTAGTMARLAAEGHRVVLVVATDGGYLRETRMPELHASARVLSCARVVHLGYNDSGLDDNAPGRLPADAPPDAFSLADGEEAAVRLARVLSEERADLLTTYDPAGGYGHPDHVRVHAVGHRAAEIAGTEVVLEATINRDLVIGPVRALARLLRRPPASVRMFLERAENSYTPGDDITHRIKVGRYARQKRAAMAAHASQRTPALLSRIPPPLFGLVFGTEWYVRRRRGS